MSVILVFGVSFVILLMGTLMFQDIQPGQIIFDLFGNPETDYLIFGIPGELLVSGIINGLIWGAVLVIIYSYLKGPSKEKVSLPVWVPGYTTSYNSKIEKPLKKDFKSKSFKKNRIIQDIESIEGIDKIHGRKLRKIGIKNVDDLLQIGYTRDGQKYLAKQIGVLPSTVLNWVYQAENQK
ncbi:DUF4332 domain-containing protein [Candidatus Bathyarchaeota archaeon]|nr:DUF4332 domain-containing protein [Candidatus Bathyarchaeota archaeon]